MPKDKSEGFFKSIKKAFDGFDDALEEPIDNIESELEIVESKQTSSSTVSSSQSLRGEGYEVVALKRKGQPVEVTVDSAPEVKVKVNGKDVKSE